MMELTYVEILGSDGASRPMLGLTRQTRDALKTYCELRWPTSRRKSVEREWGLTPDEARGVCEGTASATTIDKVWKAGGWAVLLPVLGAVIGHPVSDFIASERRKHVQAAQRERALLRDLHSVASAHRLAPAERAVQVAEPSRSFRGRVASGQD